MNAHQLVQLQVINFPLMRYRFKVGGHKEYMALKSPTIGNTQPIQQLVHVHPSEQQRAATIAIADVIQGPCYCWGWGIGRGTY